MYAVEPWIACKPQKTERQTEEMINDKEKEVTDGQGVCRTTGGADDLLFEAGGIPRVWTSF